MAKTTSSYSANQAIPDEKIGAETGNGAVAYAKPEPLIRLGEKRERKSPLDLFERAAEFTRSYSDGRGNLLRSRLEVAVAKLLQFTSTDYKYEIKISPREGEPTLAAFVTSKGVILVDDEHLGEEVVGNRLRRLRDQYPGLLTMLVAYHEKASRFGDVDIPTVTFLPEEPISDGRTQAIFIDDPSFTFDYSHILPANESCSVLHGHTSTALVEIVGRPQNGMIIDFAEAKRIIKKCLKSLDHKLFISSKYIAEEIGEHYIIKFEGPNGRFDLKVPKKTTFILQGEATSENLANETLRMILPQMPRNVDAVGVYIYEGISKGSHLLAALSRSTRSDA